VQATLAQVYERLGETATRNPEARRRPDRARGFADGHPRGHSTRRLALVDDDAAESRAQHGVEHAFKTDILFLLRTFAAHGARRLVSLPARWAATNGDREQRHHCPSRRHQRHIGRHPLPRGQAFPVSSAMGQRRSSRVPFAVSEPSRSMHFAAFPSAIADGRQFRHSRLPGPTRSLAAAARLAQSREDAGFFARGVLCPLERCSAASAPTLRLLRPCSHDGAASPRGARSSKQQSDHGWQPPASRPVVRGCRSERRTGCLESLSSTSTQRRSGSPGL
jgi:hypothetical protein